MRMEHSYWLIQKKKNWFCIFCANLELCMEDNPKLSNELLNLNSQKLFADFFSLNMIVP